MTDWGTSSFLHPTPVQRKSRRIYKMLRFFLLAGLIAAISADSCSYSSICSDHTMCRFVSTLGANCLAPTFTGVTSDADKQAIVNAHNQWRRKIAKGQETRGNSGSQPTAANMKKISWDDELATVAQRWANQCTFQHDTCRSVSRFYVGQNLYISYSKGITPSGKQDWPAAVQAWYDEVKDFSKDSVSPFQFSSGTGHYSQVVWANTDKVGCGFTGFTDPDGWYSKLYVCNYGPGGNIVGGSSSVYSIGPACSQCSGACDDGLCA